MTTRTELNIPPSTWQLNHRDSIVSIGSCFAENIGQKMVYHGFDCSVNQFGTTFSPLAIAKILDLLTEQSLLDEDKCVQNKSVYYHYDFHSRISALSQPLLLQNIAETMATVARKLQSASFLFITLGTSVGYRLISTGEYVNNCHKQPQSLFSKNEIQVDQGIEALGQSLSHIYRTFPQLKVVLTLSPVRHIKDGIVQNSLSKARCLLMLHELVARSADSAMYLPVYEWMIDDLRDYRYYADDLIHPNTQALTYLWDKFSDHFFDQETKKLCLEIAQIRSGLNHKPFHFETVEHQEFLSTLGEKAQHIQARYPHISWHD
jgi:hypothetical protein